MDTEIHLRNQKTLHYRSFLISTQYTGYVLTAEAMALILATSMAWRRKWKALILGLIIANVMILVRVAILIVYGFSGDTLASLYSPGPMWSAVLKNAYVLSDTFGYEFVTPIMVWFLATFRKKDIESWLIDAS
ncbi:MAG: hypothetical protein DHS20C16_31840 [Phycisphaerae bacterium]|nr:MAG: hypothetical protein DHS20C16_31840 [Phycisphaerae bacterium]